MTVRRADLLRGVETESSADVPVTTTWRGARASAPLRARRGPGAPGPWTTTVSPSRTSTTSTQDIALASGSNSVSCSAGNVSDIRCSSVPGKISMVLAVAAPQPDVPLAGHVGVPVQPERPRSHEDLVHRDAVTFGHPRGRRRRRASRPARRSRGRGRPGTRSRRARSRCLRVARLAPAQPHRFDLQDGATGWRVGDRELADLVGVVAEEHRGAARVGHGESLDSRRRDGRRGTGA